jgi:hypothetical protein
MPSIKSAQYNLHNHDPLSYATLQEVELCQLFQRV